MTYITHKREDGCYQRLSDHIYGTAKRAADFADSFGARMHAERIGLLHDIGKYSVSAQERQLDPEHTARVDHSSAGAQVAAHQLKDSHAAFAVAGHHGGLPDLGTKASVDDGTLMARLRKPLTGKLDASAWQTEISVAPGQHCPYWLAGVPPHAKGFANAMYTRMLFSCLVDADYLDTEAYMSGETILRGVHIVPAELLCRLERYVSPWLAGASSELNQMRSDLLRRCLHGGEDDPGLYTLTIPTGGGKTVSSLAFALSHAARHGLSRVIYVVPYTSIIEQNAQVFRDIVGEENVLEHHANVDYDGEDDRMLHLATENWDAPIVVTTAVQFFESLFSCRTSRCRKLHHIASSVVIFDEAQMLPLAYLRPCVNAIAELVQHYRVTAVLCTATQPSLGKLIREYAPDLRSREIAPDVERLYECFRRTRIDMIGTRDETEIVDRLAHTKQVLCIVNSRKRAQQIYKQLPEEGRFHLSTLMTPDHRKRVISEIKRRLAQNLSCRVVSTSLIEAGVDLDFPTVLREEAGLDSILQAAGRCNREGKRPVDERVVAVFRFDQAPPKMFAQNIAALRKLAGEHEDIASPQAIHTYFSTLLMMRGDAFTDEKGIVEKCGRMAFREIDQAFNLIESQTVPVYIPNEENRELLSLLREGRADRFVLRRLGHSAVNVYRDHFMRLRGMLDCSQGESFGILIDPQQYDEACGLAMEPEDTSLLIL